MDLAVSQSSDLSRFCPRWSAERLPARGKMVALGSMARGARRARSCRAPQARAPAMELGRRPRLRCCASGTSGRGVARRGRRSIAHALRAPRGNGGEQRPAACAAAARRQTSLALRFSALRSGRACVRRARTSSASSLHDASRRDRAMSAAASQARPARPGRPRGRVRRRGVPGRGVARGGRRRRAKVATRESGRPRSRQARVWPGDISTTRAVRGARRQRASAHLDRRHRRRHVSPAASTASVSVSAPRLRARPV